MNYEDYIDGMKSGKGENWDIIKQHNLVVGGVNFAGDFLCVARSPLAKILT